MTNDPNFVASNMLIVYAAGVAISFILSALLIGIGNAMDDIPETKADFCWAIGISLTWPICLIYLIGVWVSMATKYYTKEDPS